MNSHVTNSPLKKGDTGGCYNPQHVFPEYQNSISTETGEHAISFIIDMDGELLWNVQDFCDATGLNHDHAISALICNDQEIRTLNGKKLTNEHGVKSLSALFNRREVSYA